MLSNNVQRKRPFTKALSATVKPQENNNACSCLSFRNYQYGHSLHTKYPLFDVTHNTFNVTRLGKSATSQRPRVCHTVHLKFGKVVSWQQLAPNSSVSAAVLCGLF